MSTLHNNKKPVERSTKGFNILTIIVITITALLGIGLSIFAYVGMTSLDKEKVIINFMRAVDHRLNTIQADLTAVGAELQTVAALYQVHPDTTRQEFSNFATPILQRHPGIHSIAWIPFVDAANRESVEKKGREEISTFQFLEHGDAEVGGKKQLVPAQQRDQYYPIYHIEPARKNIDVVGFDLGTDEALLETINKARKESTFALSPRITFFQGNEKGFDVVLVLPVFNKNGEEKETAAEKKPIGVVAAVIRMPKLINEAIKKLDVSFINLYVYDKSAPKEKSFLYYYDMEPWMHWPTPPTIAGVPDDVEWLSDRTINFAGRTWTLAFRADEFGTEIDLATETLDYLIDERSFFLILGTSVGLSLGLAAMVWIMIKRIKERDQHNALEHSVQKRTEELGTKIEELKMTQAQIVDNEKLASLGTLTAGIAQELKDPLNTISDSSDQSLGLLPTITSYVDKVKGNFEATDLEGINDSINILKDNLSSIAKQGKKANSIIHTMLDHAKKSEGHFAPTDIQQILEQSIAKAQQACLEANPGVNVAVEKAFDLTVGKVDLTSEDIQRAFTNILNNAFYAVVEKKKTAPEDYIPRILVKTEKVGDKVRVTIRDNGTGIPESSHEKIFTPFFTTKPTGQGNTGLGLSLSHDIIADEHNGTLTFTSIEGQSTEFVATLPINQGK
jgi:signal transduction histidine kinase/sensor domain CHASE-containing protein